MNLIHGIVTFNRIGYLKKHIQTWDLMRNKIHKWTLFIADDGSTDGTIDYLKQLQIENVKVELIFNKRRGVHHQVNQIFKRSSEISFDFGFMAEDDVYFISPGWEDLYIEAARISGFEHLVYFNKLWIKHQLGSTFHDQTKCLYDKKRKIQSEVAAFPTMGCFWIFTENVLKEVGYFDLENFGPSGNGHTDYTIRCCRVGFNNERTLFDALDSTKYIAMQDEGYRRIIPLAKDGIDVNLIGVPHKFHKDETLHIEQRVYIPYNECKFNMLGEIV